MYEGSLSSYRSYLLQDNWYGTVLSVYQHGINVLIDEQIIFLGSQSKQLSCLGMALDDEFVKSLIDITRPKDVVTIRSGILTVYTAYDSAHIDLSDLKLTPTSIPKIHNSSHLVLLENKLNNNCLYEKMGLINSDRLKSEIDNLVSLDKYKMQKAVHYLTGRGSGLTPSGDDILLGFGIISQALGIESSLSDIIRENLNCTTMISQEYLLAMLEGYCNADLVSLIHLINYRSCTEEEVLSSIRDLSNYGHTSGVDTLYGIGIGLKLFLERSTHENISRAL